MNLTVPVELFVWAYKNKTYKEVQFYLKLKMSRRDGKCDFSYLKKLHFCSVFFKKVKH